MIPIRMLQHYAYCPRRWWLLQAAGAWRDNALTVKSELSHARVHAGGQLERRNGVRQLGGVTVYSEELQIYGKVDLLELRETPGGCEACLIEYKPTAPKTQLHRAARLQIYAQYRCLREAYGDDVKAFVYYADTRKRHELRFNAADEAILRDTIAAITEFTESGAEPPNTCGESCAGCSLADICMPVTNMRGVKEEILASIT